LQDILANLRLRERAELGRKFHEVINGIRSKTEGFLYNAAFLDPKPDWVFVFASSKNVDRSIALERMMALMRGAMAFYGKEQCLVVVDRDGAGYEVAFDQMKHPPTLEERQEGERRFGHLRIVDHRSLNLVPRDLE
jgi:hypothetical protein